MTLNRRDLLAKCMALGVVTSTANLLPSALADGWAQSEMGRKATTPAVLGPFYKRLAPGTNELRAPGDPGLPLVLSGQVYNTRGELIPDAKIEIWQTDHFGIYDLDGYRFRTTLITKADGKYDISSVMPGHYPARVCQHVHYLVTAQGHKPLVTQLYFATDPVFDGDPDKNFTRDPLIPGRDLVRPVTLVGEPKEMHAAVKFELVLETL